MKKKDTTPIKRLIESHVIENGITYAEFSRQAGISESHVSLIRSGQKLPRYDTLVKIDGVLKGKIFRF